MSGGPRRVVPETGPPWFNGVVGPVPVIEGGPDALVPSPRRHRRRDPHARPRADAAVVGASRRTRPGRPGGVARQAAAPAGPGAPAARCDRRLADAPGPDHPAAARGPRRD